MLFQEKKSLRVSENFNPSFYFFFFNLTATVQRPRYEFMGLEQQQCNRRERARHYCVSANASCPKEREKISKNIHHDDGEYKNKYNKRYADAEEQQRRVFLVSFMRVSSMFSFLLLLLFVLCVRLLFGCSAYRVSLQCCCPVQVGGGGGGGAQKDSRCTTTVVYYSSYSLVIETIQHVMSGRSSHSYNSPFCYVSLLCERAQSSSVSSHPAPPLARVTKRMRNNTHTQHRSGPHILYRRTQLHRFDIKCVFFFFS